MEDCEDEDLIDLTGTGEGNFCVTARAQKQLRLRNTAVRNGTGTDCAAKALTQNHVPKLVSIDGHFSKAPCIFAVAAPCSRTEGPFQGERVPVNRLHEDAGTASTNVTECSLNQGERESGGEEKEDYDEKKGARLGDAVWIGDATPKAFSLSPVDLTSPPYDTRASKRRKSEHGRISDVDISPASWTRRSAGCDGAQDTYLGESTLPVTSGGKMCVEDPKPGEGGVSETIKRGTTNRRARELSVDGGETRVEQSGAGKALGCGDDIDYLGPPSPISISSSSSTSSPSSPPFPPSRQPLPAALRLHPDSPSIHAENGEENPEELATRPAAELRAHLRALGVPATGRTKAQLAIRLHACLRARRLANFPSHSTDRYSDRRGKVNKADLARGDHGRALCRLCQQECPKKANTFCSPACVHEHRLRTSGSYVRKCLLVRDKGRCALCAIDAHALYLQVRRTLWAAGWGGKGEKALGGIQAVVDEKVAGTILEGKVKVRGLKQGKCQVGDGVGKAWVTSTVYGAQTRPRPRRPRRPFNSGLFWHADHILPVVEGGGLRGLENFRTLCVACHQTATAELRRRRQGEIAGGRNAGSKERLNSQAGSERREEDKEAEEDGEKETEDLEDEDAKDEGEGGAQKTGKGECVEIKQQK